MKRLAIAGIVCGGVLSGAMFLSLQKSGDTSYHKNLFALNQSGYGTVLARLGQTNLNRAWHFGEVASELSNEKGVDEHAGHNHGPGEGHGDEGAKHGENNLIESALDFLVDLDAVRFQRTSSIPMSVQQQQEVARDIEKMMLKAYNMDPTDYGAYDAYFHFLVYHTLRGKEEDKIRAFKMSEYSIQSVYRDKVNPIPWLTAATATLNQFFLNQNKYRKEKGDQTVELPRDMLVANQERMKYALAQYFKLRDEAIAEGRWEMVSADRRAEAEERARLAVKMLEQFQTMIERSEKDEEKPQEQRAN